jgi:hypothetical protein
VARQQDPLKAPDPRAWADQPIRCAIDGILYRWIALFALPVVAALLHRLAGGAEPLDSIVHVGLLAFLVAFIGVHLFGRLWRQHGAPDGWQQADAVDHQTVVVTRSVGWVVVIGAALAFIAPLGTFAQPKEFGMEVLLWFPILFPLYMLAVWVTLDCARDRLGRGVDESQSRLHRYWRRVAGRGGRSAA